MILTLDQYIVWRESNPYQDNTIIPIGADEEAFRKYVSFTQHSFSITGWGYIWETFAISQDDKDEIESRRLDTMWEDESISWWQGERRRETT